MQISVSFPESGFFDVSFTATESTLVKDVIEVVGNEWGTVPAFLELLLSGSVLSPSSRLLSHGVEADSQLTVSVIRLFRKELLTDPDMREKVGKLLAKEGIIRLDTPSFADEVGCLGFENEWIPEGILSVCFDNPDPSVTTVAPYFMLESNITNIDLTGLRHLTSIDISFLSQCSSLKTIDLSPFEGVTFIGNRFLNECSSLETISNISGLRNVTGISHYFLGNCSSLLSVDLSVFTNLQNLGTSFLYCCIALKEIDFCALGNLSFSNHYFMFGCSALKTIHNISGLNNNMYIGEGFMWGCDSLLPIDASVPGYECLSEELKEEFKALSSQ
eukprot:TRINITY_DN7232_c1_g1_i1.p1 TRINITY_DN7232_c1_g1~~TRINITY_DN7232_c1_g1_i1.p1  ORF type:complete len:331 (+),score=52.01 TRINITY_DN7232_c1_g1_i1:41-1033(+)